MVAYRFRNMASTWLPISLLVCSLIYGGTLLSTYGGSAWPSPSPFTPSCPAAQGCSSQTTMGGTGKGVSAASNSTLGFGEIFYISMPE